MAQCSVSLGAKVLTGLKVVETRLHLIGSFFFFSFLFLTDIQGIPPPSVTTVNHLLCGLEPLRPVPTWACHGPLNRGTFPPLGGQQPAVGGGGGTGAWRGNAKNKQKRKQRRMKTLMHRQKSCRINLYLPKLKDIIIATSIIKIKKISLENNKNSSCCNRLIL